MRKKLLVLIAVITIALGFSLEISASDKGREIRNILDLSNFKMDFETQRFNTINPIAVKVNSTYTIVADKSFIGHNDEISLEIGYENKPKELIELKYITDYFVLGMFTAKEEYIHINSFNFVGTRSSNIMLYEGDDSDFEENYMPYTNKDNYLSGYLEIDYDKPLSIEQIDSYVKSYNPSNDDEIKVIRSRNTYKHAIGSYEALYYSVLNNINNVFFLEIKVVDKTAPVINTEMLSYGYTELPSIDKVLSDIKINDNVDTIKVEDIEVIDTNYHQEVSVGNYFINIKVMDKANNTSEKKINIVINDNIGPKIIGPNALFIYTTQVPLTKEKILNNFLISDDNTSADNIKIDFILNEYNETTLPGKYNLTIKATDNSNNETTKTIVIHVIDNQQSEYNIDPIIKTNTKVLISAETIIEKFTSEAKKLGMNITDISVNKDIYELNYTKAGEYTTYIEYLLDGTPKYAEVTILVADDNKGISPYIYAIPIVILLGVAITIITKKKRQSN